MGDIKFEFDISKLYEGMQGYKNKSDVALFLYANTAAKKLEGYMKTNAPWTDRTSNARQSLSSMVSKIPLGYRITLSHGVDYGIFLELANEKKYAIVAPTVNTQSSGVFAGLSNLLKVG